MAYPATLPSYTITSGSETLNGLGGGTGLSGILNAMEGDITALGTKVGTGATVPAANTLLVGTGAGTSAWQGLTSAQLAAIMSDETGTGALVFGSSPTIVTPTIASFANANHNHQNSAGGGVLTGSVTQVQSLTTSAVATGSTLIPFDDTIPQSTEGDQYMTLSITPRATTNTLVIEVVTVTGSSVANHHVMALFQDAGVNALNSIGFYQATNAGIVNLHLLHSVVAGTTSSTAFKVRLGQESAGTLTFNGRSGARVFGAITKSSIVITEYVS